jgi:hypothetical protein
MIEGKYTEPDILKFKKDEVQKVIDYAVPRPNEKGNWWGGYDSDDKGELVVAPSKEPTILLVGDDGVYIMSGGYNKPLEQGHPLAYAEGCNPKVDEFDDWWALKRATWGGDDGVESLIVDEIQPILNKCKTHLIVAFKEEDGKDVFDITHD